MNNEENQKENIMSDADKAEEIITKNKDELLYEEPDELEDWQEEILDRLWANVDELDDFTDEELEKISDRTFWDEEEKEDDRIND